MQEVTAEQMYGIAKKFNKEMEDFPLHSHSAIVELVRVGMQHRSLAVQRAEQEAQIARQEQALDLQRQQMEFAQRKAALDSLSLVTQ